MASSSVLSPVLVIQELISITNVDKNKQAAMTQVKLAFSKAMEYLPIMEAWEASHKSLQEEKDSLMADLDATFLKLQEKANLLSVQKALTDKATHRALEAQRIQEETRLILAQSEETKHHWEEVSKVTEEKLNQILDLLTAKSNKTTQEKLVDSSSIASTSAGVPLSDRQSISQEQGWTMVQKKNQKTRKRTYRMYFRGPKNRSLKNVVLHQMMTVALQNENIDLTSAVDVKDYPLAVAILVTCPIQLQRAVDAFTNAGLWVTHSRFPSPQLVLTSRYDADLPKLVDDIYNLLHMEGYKEEEISGIFIRTLRRRGQWFTWSVMLPPGMERVLLDRGRFVSGMTTFRVRRFFSIQQCSRCLQYGHAECKEKPRCFRCGSAEHQARVCKSSSRICVPCKLEGLPFSHQDRQNCPSYKKYLDSNSKARIAIPDKRSDDKDTRDDRQREALHDRASQAETPVHLKKQQVVQSDPLEFRTPKLKRAAQPKNLLPETLPSIEDDTQVKQPATV